MNKQELIDIISTTADISKTSAARALEAVTENVAKSLARGESVALIGFGTFDVSHRAARKGRNPKTGETIDIAASKLVRFKAGKTLKDQVNK